MSETPRMNDEFVWMAAKPEAWRALTEKVERVEEDLGDGRFRVGYIKPPLPKVATVFMDKYGPDFFKGKYARTVVVRGPDGRWWDERALESSND